jgi:hypothetical protein
MFNEQSWIRTRSNLLVTSPTHWPLHYQSTQSSNAFAATHCIGLLRARNEVMQTPNMRDGTQYKLSVTWMPIKTFKWTLSVSMTVISGIFH